MKKLLTTSLILSLAACGDVAVHHLPDGPPGSIDAPPATSIKIHTYGSYGNRAPVPGVQVVFNEPGGHVTRLASDLDGLVETSIAPDTQVTAVWLTSPNNYSLETITGAKNGDELVFAGTGYDYTTVGQFTVSYPSFPGATSYTVGGDCGTSGSTATSQTITMYKYCATAKQTFWVVAYDASGAAGYLERPNADYTPQGSLSLNGTYAPYQSMSAQFTNLDPTTEGSINFARYATRSQSAYASGQVVGTTLAVNAQVAPAAAAFVVTGINNSNYTRYQQIVQNTAGNSFAYNLDVGANLAPWIDLPTMDMATATVTVPVTGTGPIDGGYVTVNYSKAKTVGTATTYTYFTWTVIGATLRDPIVLPTIPSELGDVNPAAADGFNGGDAAIIESEDILGYDTLRNDLLGAFNSASNAPSAGTHILRISRGVNNT